MMPNRTASRYRLSADPVRYYYHGDRHEHGAAEGHYCARCDLFQQWPHFRPGACKSIWPGTDARLIEKGRQALHQCRRDFIQGWSITNYHRPANPPTVWSQRP